MKKNSNFSLGKRRKEKCLLLILPPPPTKTDNRCPSVGLLWHVQVPLPHRLFGPAVDQNAGQKQILAFRMLRLRMPFRHGRWRGRRRGEARAKTGWQCCCGRDGAKGRGGVFQGVHYRFPIIFFNFLKIFKKNIKNYPCYKTKQKILINNFLAVTF